MYQKKTMDVLSVADHRVCHKVVKNDPRGFQQLEEWLKADNSGQVHACLEATGQYGEEVAEYLKFVAIKLVW